MKKLCEKIGKKCVYQDNDCNECALKDESMEQYDEQQKRVGSISENYPCDAC